VPGSVSVSVSVSESDPDPDPGRRTCGPLTLAPLVPLSRRVSAGVVWSVIHSDLRNRAREVGRSDFNSAGGVAGTKCADRYFEQFESDVFK
jgi:hypothetical protein